MASFDFIKAMNDILEKSLALGTRSTMEMAELFATDYPVLFDQHLRPLGLADLSQRFAGMVKRMMAPVQQLINRQLVLPGMPVPGAVLVPRPAGPHIAKLWVKCTLPDLAAIIEEKRVQEQNDRASLNGDRRRYRFLVSRCRTKGLSQTTALIEEILKV